jgi:TonB family protein
MQSLLSISLGANVAGIADSFNGIKLIRRLKMLNKEKSGSTAKLKYLALLPVLAALFFVFACTEQDTFKKKENTSIVDVDTYPKASLNLHEEITNRLNLSEDWANGTKSAKFSVKFTIDKEGKMGEPYISGAKFAQSRRWSKKSIDKEIERQIIAAVKDINPTFNPAMKDGKPVEYPYGIMLLLGSKSKWYTYNAAGKVSVKLADRDYVITYDNRSEEAASDEMGLPVLSNAQCHKLPKIMAYPDEARAVKAKGDIELTFSVDEKGNARDIKIVKGMGYGCDEAAVTALSKLGGFRPNQTFNGNNRLPLVLSYKHVSDFSFMKQN